MGGLQFEAIVAQFTATKGDSHDELDDECKRLRHVVCIYDICSVGSVE